MYGDVPCTLEGRQSITERLKEERKNLSERLSKVEDALVALQENPELAKVLETISRVI